MQRAADEVWVRDGKVILELPRHDNSATALLSAPQVLRLVEEWSKHTGPEAPVGDPKDIAFSLDNVGPLDHMVNELVKNVYRVAALGEIIPAQFVVVNTDDSSKGGFHWITLAYHVERNATEKANEDATTQSVPFNLLTSFTVGRKARRKDKEG